VAWADSFRVTDVVYTDVTGGAKVPPAYLGMNVPLVSARIRSHDFFAVLLVLRDLLLVAPPPDVKELAELKRLRIDDVGDDEDAEPAARLPETHLVTSPKVRACVRAAQAASCRQSLLTPRPPLQALLGMVEQIVHSRGPSRQESALQQTIAWVPRRARGRHPLTPPAGGA
jgi:hypothetical protein